jgi:predicted nucleotidyltransferase
MDKYDMIMKEEAPPFLPKEYAVQVRWAVQFLKKAGAKEVFLFGSLITGKINKNSDIDLGIKGLPPELFFKIYGELSISSEKHIDLVDFDSNSDLFTMLQTIDEVIQVG